MDIKELRDWYEVVLKDAMQQAARGQKAEWDWIFNENEYSGPFSFKATMLVLGMDAEKVRYGVRRCMKLISMNNPINLELENIETPDTNVEFAKRN